MTSGDQAAKSGDAAIKAKQNTKLLKNALG